MWHTVKATSNKFYHFKDWTEDGVSKSGDSTYTFQVTHSRHLVANFISETFPITLIANPEVGGTVSGGGDHFYNVEITVKAQPNLYYSFINWTENDIEVSTDANYTFVVTEARTLVANFERKECEIILLANPPDGGTVFCNGVEDGGIYLSGTPVIIEAIENPTYGFMYWTDENDDIFATDPTHSFIVTESLTLTAHFTTEIYRIEVIANPEEWGEVEGGGVYSYGDIATVLAKTDPLHRFINWMEDGLVVSTDAEYTFTVTESRTLIANFNKFQYVVIAEADEEYGYTEGSGVYDAGATASVKVIEYECHRFKNWTINGKVVSLSNPYEFTVTEDVTIIANFHILDFDTYCPTLWNNTFLLDMRKLRETYGEIIGCKWFKNDVWEEETQTIDEFSYSAGPKETDLLEAAPTYYSFHLITQNYGELCSTPKFINNYIMAPPPNVKIWVHPNPVLSGAPFTVENVVKNDEIRVFNQYGICVYTGIANGETITLTLHVEAGAYVIWANEKQVKVVIVK
jgi:hypothetical protein